MIPLSLTSLITTEVSTPLILLIKLEFYAGFVNAAFLKI
jgi:hypothetical protein